jgi:hypothetical protein
MGIGFAGSGEIGAPSTVGLPDDDSYVLQLSEGQVAKVIVEAAAELQPSLVWIEPSLPVEGRTAVEFDCELVSCSWDLTLVDLRNLEGPTSWYGGEGFEYQIRVENVDTTPQTIEFPFSSDAAAEEIILDDVGNVLRLSASLPPDELVLCDAYDPSERLDVLCSYSPVQNPGDEIFFGRDAGSLVYLRDRYHRGYPDAPISLWLRSFAIPDAAPELSDGDLPTTLPLPAEITGAASTPQPTGYEVNVEVAAGEGILAYGTVNDNHIQLDIEFLDPDGLGRTHRGIERIAGFVADTAGEVVLRARISCQPDDDPCRDNAAYELMVFGGGN